YYHSNAHAGRSCDEYERQLAKQEKEMRNAGVLADSKQCPRCGVHTVKISGCNHMTCAERTCKCEWCWVCGQEIE
ncbi:rnf19b, partial [Symbiodinium microadriaticum]